MGALTPLTDPPKPADTMKVIALLVLCVAVALSQDVPDLCESCVNILTQADYTELSACLDKDLVDRQICFKGGQICIEVDAVVEETIKLAQSLLAANTDPREICTLAGICDP